MSLACLNGIVPSALRFLGFNAKLTDRGALITEIGLQIYDFYNRKVRALPDHRFLSSRKLRVDHPAFAPDIKAAGLYYEGRITHAERLGLIGRHLDTADRQFSFRLDMRGQHLGIVHRIDMIAAQNQHIVRFVSVDDIQVLVDRIGGTLVPLRPKALLRRYDLDELADLRAHEAPGALQVADQ